MRLNAVEKTIIEDMASIANKESLASTINNVRKRYPEYEKAIKEPKEEEIIKKEEPINIDEIKQYMEGR